jgi:hypothetical protein
MDWRPAVQAKGWGPHVMIVGTAAREMASIYPSTMDPDPSQAYVMYPGTPYEHLMPDTQANATKYA